jgi:muramoyltetrapeptide carboxypeptidase
VREIIVPAPAALGDVVRVIAPSGVFDRALFWRGLGWLSRHFEVRYDRGVFARAGLFAGDDLRRAAELDAALRCTEARAVIAARGGVGCTRLLPGLDVSALRVAPKWLVGFSDVTALHCFARRAGVASLHAHNVTGLGRGDDAERERWLNALCRPSRQRRTSVEMLTPGRARGTLTGGNLVLLHDLAISGAFRPPPGSVVFFEEVAEPPYRIDRMLGALERSGFFDRVRGVVVGDVTESAVAANGVRPIDVFRSLGKRCGLPVGWGYPSGHGRRNDPLPLGLPVVLEEGVVTINPG